MWKHMARIIGEVRPRYVYVENSPMLVSRGLDTVLADLATLGFDAKWGVVSAADVGAPHKRDRIWILANSKLYGCASSSLGRIIETAISKQQKRKDNALDIKRASCISASRSDVANTINQGSQGRVHRGQDSQRESELGYARCSSSTYGQQKQRWWAIEPNVGRVANGSTARVDRLKAL
jgi:DNA (cytosine-5)-methyltransferase 1